MWDMTLMFTRHTHTCVYVTWLTPVSYARHDSFIYWSRTDSHVRNEKEESGKYMDVYVTWLIHASSMRHDSFMYWSRTDSHVRNENEESGKYMNVYVTWLIHVSSMRHDSFIDLPRPIRIRNMCERVWQECVFEMSADWVCCVLTFQIHTLFILSHTCYVYESVVVDLWMSHVSWMMRHDTTHSIGREGRPIQCVVCRVCCV